MVKLFKCKKQYNQYKKDNTKYLEIRDGFRHTIVRDNFGILENEQHYLSDIDEFDQQKKKYAFDEEKLIELICKYKEIDFIVLEIGFWSLKYLFIHKQMLRFM